MTGATELTEYERQAVQRDANVSLVMLLDTVQRIKAEAAAAPDALRVAVEALAAEWDAECEHDGSAQCKGCAALRRAARMLRALLGDG